MGNGGSLPGGENDRGVKLITPPSSAEVKNAWSYNCTTQYAFMAWCSIKKSNTGTTLTLPLLSGVVSLINYSLL